MDAIGTLPFVLSLTREMNPAERSRTVRHAMLTALGLGLVFVGVGKGVFWLLGIDIADFMVAGGIVLLVLSIRYLMTGKLVEFEPILGGSMIGVVPIGTPLVVGPAVLTTLLLLTERFPLWLVLLSFLINIAFAWVVFTQASRVVNLLRREGVGAISQIASLLLAAIAVMMIRQGIMEILTG